MSTFETRQNLKDIVKAILFVAGDGVEVSFIAEKLDIDDEELKVVIDELKKEFSGDNGIHLISYKGKVQFTSNPNYATQVSDVLSPIREKSLTRAALETLAIVAYKQPITKLEIEDIRRVNSDYAVQVLLDQNMIEIAGRKDAVGRPLLFATTENFLKRFNIESVEKLPSYEELLERIKVLDEGEEKSDTLFKNTDNFKFEDEETPDFLKGEELVKVSGDDEEFFANIDEE